MPPSAADLAERADLILQIRAARDACFLYRPNPIQAAFHACMARYRILRGVNRGGKTCATAYELASCARRQRSQACLPRQFSTA